MGTYVYCFLSMVLFSFSTLADSRRAEFYTSQIQIVDRQIESLQALIVYEEKNLIAAYKVVKGMTSSVKIKESFGFRQLASGQTSKKENKPVLDNKTAALTSVVSWAEGYLFRRSTAGKLGGYAGTLVGLSDGELTDARDIAEFGSLFAKMDVLSMVGELENIQKTLSTSQRKLAEYKHYRTKLLEGYVQLAQR